MSGENMNQKVDSITIQQSKTLIKNMIRISVSSICYHRDIFPPSCFVFKPYGNMEIVQLDAAIINESGEIVVKDPKAFILTQWLEKGVFKVLEDNFLASMTFAIYTKHPTTQVDLLLEAYEFKFTYVDGKPHVNGVSVKSKDDIKLQAGKFVRNLVLFSSSLDELPTENWITIEMKYDKALPDDYEPEYFQTVDRSSLRFDGLNCLRVKLGRIETPYLSTDAKFIGLESLLHENLCKIGMIPSNTESIDKTSIFKASSASKTLLSEDKRNEEVGNKFDHMKIEEDQENAILNKIRNYVLETGRSDLKGVEIDLNLSSQKVKEGFQVLVKENVLSLTKNRYKVNKQAIKSKLNGCYKLNSDSKLSNPSTQPIKDNKIQVPVIIEDIEDIASTTTPSPYHSYSHLLPRKTITPITFSRNALQFKSKEENKGIVDTDVKKSPQSVVEQYSSKQETIGLLYSQASDYSESTDNTFKSKKRLYGQIKDPIQVDRNWMKKTKMESVVTQL